MVQPLEADLGQFALHSRAQDHLTHVGLDEQAHLADELAGSEITQHQLAAVVLLGDDADRAADHVIQRAGGVSGAEHVGPRSEEHTSELQSLMRISYAVFCLKKKKTN